MLIYWKHIFAMPWWFPSWGFGIVMIYPDEHQCSSDFGDSWFSKFDSQHCSEGKYILPNFFLHSKSPLPSTHFCKSWIKAHIMIEKVDLHRMNPLPLPDTSYLWMLYHLWVCFTFEAVSDIVYNTRNLARQQCTSDVWQPVSVHDVKCCKV